MREATTSRWPCPPVRDDTVFRTDGGPLDRVGRWWSGQHKRVVSSMDGVVWLIVIGDGQLVVPVDCAVRRPNPQGPGARCRDTRTWSKVMRDETCAAWARRGLELPPPLVVAESWLRDAKVMRHVADAHQGTLLVQGKAPSTFALEDGRQVHGRDVIQDDAWPWQQRLHAPGCRSVRLRAKRPTSGAVTVMVVGKPGDDRLALGCRATQVQMTRWLRAWARRNLIEPVCRLLKHLLATDACHVHSEEAYDGHLVRRLMTSFVLSSTSRVLCKGHVTMDEMVCNLKHHWSSVDCEALELYGVSYGCTQKPASILAESRERKSQVLEISDGKLL